MLNSLLAADALEMVSKFIVNYCTQLFVFFVLLFAFVTLFSSYRKRKRQRQIMRESKSLIAEHFDEGCRILTIDPVYDPTCDSRANAVIESLEGTFQLAVCLLPKSTAMEGEVWSVSIASDGSIYLSQRIQQKAEDKFPERTL